MRADGDDRAVDLVDAAQQLDLDLIARVVALQPGRDDAAARLRGPARSARRPRGAAARRPPGRPRNRAGPAPSRPCRPRRRACARAGRWSADGAAAAAPSSPASSGAAKMSKVRAAETGKPGAPSTGVASTAPEDHRVAGSDGDAVYREDAGSRHEPRRCSRRGQRWSRRRRSRRSASAAASRTAAAIWPGSSGWIGGDHASHPASGPARPASASWCRGSRPGAAATRPA